jgi:hypothetical protein
VTFFDERSQPEYAGIEMIRMPHAHSNISMTVKLGVIDSQFYRFLRLCSCKKCFVFQMVSLIVFLKAKDYPLKVLLMRTRGFLKKNSCLEFLLLAFSERFCFRSCKWGASCKPTCSQSFPVLFPFFVSVFLCLVFVVGSVASH